MSRSGRRRPALLVRVMAALAALGAPFVLASAARGQEGKESLDKPARDALTAIAKGLILAAVDDTAKACDLAGPELPSDLRKDFEAIHAAPRAKDVRDARSANLKKAMLKSLIDESPEAQEVLRRLGDLAAKGASELDDLVTRATKARTDAHALLKDSTDGKYMSPAAVAAGKAGPMGPLLLRLAKAAPFLRGEVTAPDATYDARYRALERAYEKAPDPQAALLLAMLTTIEAKGAGTGTLDAPDVKKLLQLVKGRLDAARDATVDAMKDAKETATSLRQGELSRAVSGTRNADLEYAVKILAAYKKQFSAAPALDATEIAGVYFDRNTNRVYFYVDGEDRWVAGAPHAAPLNKVIEFLLKAQDARLTRRTTDPRALALLYHAFGEGVPFESGMEAAQRTAQKVCARARALMSVAAKGGATPEQVDRFLAEQAGYDHELAGPVPGLDDEACAKRAMEKLVRAVMDGRADAASAITSELEAALAALEKVKLYAFTGIKVEAPAGVGEVTLSLRTDMLRTPPLVAPPRTLVAGGAARCVLVVQDGESPKGAALEGEASGPAGEPFHGSLALDVAAAPASGHVEGGSLALKPGAVLTLSGKRGTRVKAGERLVARLHPARAARLRLAREKEASDHGTTPEEVGPWTRDGGVIEPNAAWAAGKWTANAFDDENHLLGSATFEVEKEVGVVCVNAAENRILFARPGTKVDVRLLQSGALLPDGKATLALEYATGGLAWAPKEPLSCPKAVLELPADLAPGRYRVVAQVGKASLVGWPLAIVKEEPRVSLVRDPFCVDAPSSIGAGEKLYARIEPGFAIEPGEVASAIVELQAVGRGAAAKLRTTPVPGFPVTGLVLPIALNEKVPPGPWDILADVYVAAGRLRARGKVVIDASAEMPFTLKPVDGPDRTLYARGDRAQVSLSAAAGITSATFILVGPDGLGTPVEPDEQGNVNVAIASDAAVGSWELRGSTRQDGSILQKAVGFRVYAPSRFSVSVKGHVGEQGLVDVPIPAGYVEPVRVKVGSVWTDGNKAIVVPIEGATSVPVILEDKNGRRADGEARIEIVAERPTETGPLTPARAGPRFAVVANLKEKTFFFPGYDSVSRMLREARVPKDWVVVESGPLSAGQARDWVFTKAPYDGPPATNPLSVYRTQRYFKNLKASVQAQFQAGGCGPDTVFDVTNSPVTEDEKTTVAMLASRITDEKGGWTWELDRVRVRSVGALPDPTPPREKELLFQGASWNGDAGNVTNLAVPGALGDLALRADFPAKLVLGKPSCLSVSVASVPSALATDRTYPGGLEKLVARALQGTSLEGSIDVEGKTIAVLASTSWASLGGDRVLGAGRELVFTLTPAGTEKLEDGTARVAESMGFRASPAGTPAAGLDLRFEPIPPGTLANVAKRLVIKLKARLALALPVGDLPKDQPPPDATFELGGTTYALDPVDAGQLPRTEIEIEVIYVRQAFEGAPARANPPPALGPSRLVGDKPEALGPLDPVADLTASVSELASSKPEQAAAHARRSLLADPSRAEAWLVLAEALAAQGALPEARTAARRALAGSSDADLSARARKILGE